MQSAHDLRLAPKDGITVTELSRFHCSSTSITYTPPPISHTVDSLETIIIQSNNRRLHASYAIVTGTASIDPGKSVVSRIGTTCLNGKACVSTPGTFKVSTRSSCTTSPSASKPPVLTRPGRTRTSPHQLTMPRPVSAGLSKPSPSKQPPRVEDVASSPTTTTPVLRGSAPMRRTKRTHTGPSVESSAWVFAPPNCKNEHGDDAVRNGSR